MSEKYGFVYIWFDRKRKKYYIGKHWGTTDDGYICSSLKYMMPVYKRRPEDFKRRILEYVYDKTELTSREKYWLRFIKKEELGVRYYNLSRHAFSFQDDPLMYDEICAKISKAQTGRIVSEETREKLRQANLGKVNSEESNEKRRQANYKRDYSDPEMRKKQSEAAKNRSPETRKLISENNKRLQAEGKIGMKGKSHSEETKKKQSAGISAAYAKRRAEGNPKISPNKGKQMSEEQKEKIRQTALRNAQMKRNDLFAAST